MKEKEPRNVICTRYQSMLQTNNNFPYENKRSRNTAEMEATLEEFKNVDKTTVPRDFTGIDGRPIKKVRYKK